MADIERQQPMTPDTVLYIGSVSKVLTAVLTLNLVEAGELSMDDSIDLVADAPRDNPVRLRHLVTHYRPALLEHRLCGPRAMD